MTTADWSENELAYLVGWVILDECDDLCDGSVSQVVYDMKGEGGYLSASAFSSWDDDRRRRIAKEVLSALARDGVAEFWEGPPIDPIPERKWYRFRRSGPIKVWSREEVNTWANAHMLTPAQVDEMLERLLPVWWSGERTEERYEFTLTDKGTALYEELWKNGLPQDLVDRVGGRGSKPTESPQV